MVVIVSTLRYYPHLPRLYSCLCNPFLLALLAASLDTVLTFPGISVPDILVRSGQVSDEARGLPRTRLLYAAVAGVAERSDVQYC